MSISKFVNLLDSLVGLLKCCKMASIVALVAETAFTRTYYVSVNDKFASDLNPGTRSLPLKTIQKATDIAGAGDTVYVLNGTYKEQVEVTHGGTSYKDMLSFIAGGDSVIVDGADQTADWTNFSGAIWTKNNWSVNSQQVFVDGEPLQQIGGNEFYSPDRLPRVGYGKESLFPGSFYYAPETKTLYVWLKDGGDPNSHRVEVSVRPLLFVVRNQEYIFITGFKFIHSNSTALIKSGWPSVNMTGGHSVIRDCDVEWCDCMGIGGTVDSLLVERCISNHNGNCGFSFSGKYVRMVGNTSNYNNYRNFNVHWHAGGVKNVRVQYSTIGNQTSIGNNGAGIWLDIDCIDDTILGCLITGNTTGIQSEISRHTVLFNNLVYSNSDRGIYISASDSCLVANNTIVGNSYGVVVHGMPRAGYQLIGNTMVNNIIGDNKSAEFLLAKPATGVANNTADYNLFYQTGGAADFRFGYSGLIVGLSAWSGATDLDSHSLEADPEFVNQSAGDFKLRAGSPAIGRGVPVSFITKDFYGKSRLNQKCLGACEP